MSAQSFSRRALALALIGSLILQPVLAQLPDLGDPARAGLSAAKEKQIGQIAMRDIRLHEPSYIDDPEVEYYMNSLGRRLAAAGGAIPEDFNFFVLRDPTLNAFAMPGGYIAVHSGLVLAAQTESELAGVVGHEIGHVEQHHIARSVDQSGTATATVLASLLLAILAGSRGGSSGGALAEAALVGGQAAAMQRQLTFSQSFEREADRVGLQTMQATGFDPQGMVSFFERLGKASGPERADTAFLRTHPLSRERMADMQGRVKEGPPRVVADSNDFVLFRAKLDAEAGLPRDALNRVKSRTAMRRQDQAARWYAIAHAALRDRNTVEASKALAQLRDMQFESPFVEMLAARVASAQGKHAEAARICREGWQRYPAARYLLLAEADELLEDGKPQQVAVMARDALVDEPGNERLYLLQAKAFAAQGKTADQQLAQAELFALRDNLPAAIQQLQLAQRSGEGDHITQAAIDSRLRELRARLKDQKSNKLE
ncbi:M48 family metalloprotease [Uliginosibacterium sp. H3]|uniref:M48 family metalloprotease n=1 Tax=Uliginosibacterium silvisoli TaxID=3114758 RepID=A0ABU6K4Z6_9RHOO|nr:M48 family metalloprotease [Uliginosibacterium sp. H3]